MVSNINDYQDFLVENHVEAKHISAPHPPAPKVPKLALAPPPPPPPRNVAVRSTQSSEDGNERGSEVALRQTLSRQVLVDEGTAHVLDIGAVREAEEVP